IDKYPEFSFAYQTLGEIYFHSGNGRAVESFDRAVQLDPHNGTAYLWLSKVERHGNDRKLYAAVAEQVQPPTAIAVSQGGIAIARNNLEPTPKPEPRPEPGPKTATVGSDPASVGLRGEHVPVRQYVCHK